MCKSGRPSLLVASRRNVREPVPLNPILPIGPGELVRLQVRGSNGRIRTRKVLQHVETTSSSTTTKSSYVIDRVINQHIKNSITLVKATPVTADPDGCMVACGSPVIVKAVPHPDAKRPSGVDNPLTEIAALQHLTQHNRQSPHVIRLLDCMADDDFLYLVLPYLPGGDLLTYVQDMGERSMPEAKALQLFRQMCEGLLFMKSAANLAHQDVSLENVVLNSQHDRATVVDLGMCIRVPKPEREEQPGSSSCCNTKAGGSSNAPVYLRPKCCGKPNYVAPEVLREDAFDAFAADIWSLGVCLYMLLVGRPLYQSPSDKAFKIMECGGTSDILTLYETYGLILSPLAKDLVCRMLDANASERPTLEEVLAHPLLSETKLAVPRPCASAGNNNDGDIHSGEDVQTSVDGDHTITNRRPTASSRPAAATKTFD